MFIRHENKYPYYVIIITFFIFFHKFSIPFIWDDFPFIVNNESIHSLNNLWKAFYEDIALLYRPLRQVLFTVNYALFSENPFGYHLTGLTLHICITLILYASLNILFNNRLVNLAAVLIFAVHPVHSERVYLITGSFDLLGDFFTVLAFYFYLLHKKRKSERLWYIALFTFLLGLLSSEVAIIFLPLIVAYDFIFTEKGIYKDRCIKAYLPALFIIFGYLIARYLTLHSFERVEAEEGYFNILFSMPHIFFQYLYLLFFPIHLTVYRTPQLPDNAYFFYNLICLLGIALILFQGFYSKRDKALRFSILWFFICLIPFSNIVNSGNLMEERYLYLPSFALSLFFIYLSRVVLVKRKKVFIFFSIAVLVLFATLTINKGSFYQSEEIMWQKSIRTLNFLYSNKYRETIKKRVHALDINKPLQSNEILNRFQSKSFYNAANTLQNNSCNVSIPLYMVALVLNYQNIDSWHNLYNCYGELGRVDEVAVGLKKFIEAKNLPEKVKINSLMMLTDYYINTNNPDWKKYSLELMKLNLDVNRKFEALKNAGIGFVRNNQLTLALHFFTLAEEVKDDQFVKNRIEQLQKILQ
ncbi:MAG: glycosyltransferase family 39 protein [Nitrospinae bacterium]|nr:glycosyltransferase family 39 protein [Nitrospinota bacterium]